MGEVTVEGPLHPSTFPSDSPTATITGAEQRHWEEMKSGDSVDDVTQKKGQGRNSAEGQESRVGQGGFGKVRKTLELPLEEPRILAISFLLGPQES